MSDRDLMQQALEDLRMVAPDTCVETIEALRARLAEPDDEPVAHFGSAYVNENGVHVTTVLGPVAIPIDAKLYTRPAARKVQPLTPSQVHELCQECYLDWHRGWSIDEEPNRYLLLARAIERFHGITGDSHD